MIAQPDILQWKSVTFQEVEKSGVSLGWRFTFNVPINCILPRNLYKYEIIYRDRLGEWYVSSFKHNELGYIVLGGEVDEIDTYTSAWCLKEDLKDELIKFASVNCSNFDIFNAEPP